MTTALIMAGGRSERMRRTFGPRHKSLLPVAGVSLLERNLCQVLAAGIRKITVAAAEPEIEAYVSTRGRELAAARQASLECLIERQPLGTIGAARLAMSGDAPLLMLFVDNLTSLDFRALVAHHEQQRAAMTLATHAEPFRIPFGEVRREAGRIADYLEKSVHPIVISSGIYVISPRAAQWIPAESRMDAPHLVHEVLRRADLVADFPHTDLWIDVNDADRLKLAEQMVLDHAPRLDQWPAAPDRTDEVLVACRGEQLGAVESAGGPRLVAWRLVAGRLGPASHSAAGERASGAATIEPLGSESLDAEPLGAFDTLEMPDGQIVRNQVSLVSLAANAPTPADWPKNLQWISRADAATLEFADSLSQRAWLRAFRHLDLTSAAAQPAPASLERNAPHVSA